MVRKVILWTLESSRESHLKKVKLVSNEKKLTIDIIRGTVFQNVTSILREVHVLLTADQKYQKLFQEISVVGFCNGKRLKDRLVRVSRINKC